MGHYFWQGRGIAARLLAIAVLPAVVMFIAATVTLYVTARSDVRRDVAARGQLIATALAQSSQYGLVSGNVAHLRITLRNLLEADPSIACIDITDAEGLPVVSACQALVPVESDTFEVPSRLESLPKIELFQPGPVPESPPLPVPSRLP